MKELVSIASNTLANKKKDGSLEARCELIFVVSEPEYELTSGGDVVRRRKMKETRVVANEEGLLSIIEALKDAVGDVQEFQYDLDDI